MHTTKMTKKKKQLPAEGKSDFARQYRIGMRNRRKLGKKSMHYEQG